MTDVLSDSTMHVHNASDAPHFHDGDIIYRWDVGHVLSSLYGLPVLASSLIPDGRVLTIRNTAGQTLVIRGETHDDKIRFIHLCGEGGDLSLGAWVPLSDMTNTYALHLDFLKGLTWNGGCDDASL